LSLDVNVLEVELKKVSRGRYGLEKAESLVEAARESVGVVDGRNGISREINSLLSFVTIEERYVLEIEKEMKKELEKVSYSKSLRSVPSIGTITAACLIGEVGDFCSYKTIPEIMKFAGLDLYELSSGKHQGVRRISKRGRGLIRKILYFASLRVVREGQFLHKTYQRHLSSGMAKPKALTAISRKLLGLLFSLAKNNSYYDKDYEEKKRGSVIALKKAA
jgi:transposase